MKIIAFIIIFAVGGSFLYQYDYTTPDKQLKKVSVYERQRNVHHSH
jgi:hypothetical protein